MSYTNINVMPPPQAGGSWGWDWDINQWVFYPDPGYVAPVSAPTPTPVGHYEEVDTMGTIETIWVPESTINVEPQDEDMRYSPPSTIPPTSSGLIPLKSAWADWMPFPPNAVNAGGDVGEGVGSMYAPANFFRWWINNEGWTGKFGSDLLTAYKYYQVNPSDVVAGTALDVHEGRIIPELGIAEYATPIPAGTPIDASLLRTIVGEEAMNALVRYGLALPDWDVAKISSDVQTTVYQTITNPAFLALLGVSLKDVVAQELKPDGSLDRAFRDLEYRLRSLPYAVQQLAQGRIYQGTRWVFSFTAMIGNGWMKSRYPSRDGRDYWYKRRYF